MHCSSLNYLNNLASLKFSLHCVHAKNGLCIRTEKSPSQRRNKVYIKVASFPCMECIGHCN